MFPWGKMSSEIGTVLHWRPPHVHIFGTDHPYIVPAVSMSTYQFLHSHYL